MLVLPQRYQLLLPPRLPLQLFLLPRLPSPQRMRTRPPLSQPLSPLPLLRRLPPRHPPRRRPNLKPKRVLPYRPTRERSPNLRTRSPLFPSPTNPYRARRPTFQKARWGTPRARASARGSRPLRCVPMCSSGFRSSSAQGSRSTVRWARGLHPTRRSRRRRPTRMQT